MTARNSLSTSSRPSRSSHHFDLSDPKVDWETFMAHAKFAMPLVQLESYQSDLQKKIERDINLELPFLLQRHDELTQLIDKKRLIVGALEIKRSPPMPSASALTFEEPVETKEILEESLSSSHMPALTASIAQTSVAETKEIRGSASASSQMPEVVATPCVTSTPKPKKDLTPMLPETIRHHSLFTFLQPAERLNYVTINKSNRANMHNPLQQAYWKQEITKLKCELERELTTQFVDQHGKLVEVKEIKPKPILRIKPKQLVRELDPELQHAFNQEIKSVINSLVIKEHPPEAAYRDLKLYKDLITQPLHQAMKIIASSWGTTWGGARLFKMFLDNLYINACRVIIPRYNSSEELFQAIARTGNLEFTDHFLKDHCSPELKSFHSFQKAGLMGAMEAKPHCDESFLQRMLSLNYPFDPLRDPELICKAAELDHETALEFFFSDIKNLKDFQTIAQAAFDRAVDKEKLAAIIYLLDKFNKKSPLLQLSKERWKKVLKVRGDLHDILREVPQNLKAQEARLESNVSSYIKRIQQPKQMSTSSNSSSSSTSPPTEEESSTKHLRV